MPPVRPTRANPAWLRLLPGALIGLAAALVSLTFWSGGLLQSWEAVTFDWRARLLAAPGPNTDNIRLILLDQKSLDWAEEHFGLSWPWPRQVYAPIIDFCRRAGAKSIAFDVVYTEPSVYGVSDDEALGTAMKTFGRTVMPVDLHLDDGSDEHWPDFAPALLSVIPGFDQWPGTKELTMNLATFPIPEVATNTTVLGNVSFSPDMDTVYRRLPLVQFFDGHQVPSLPLAAYLAAHPDASLSLVDGVLQVDSLLAPLRHPGTVVLNYRGTTEVFRPVSAAAVIQSELQLLEGAKPVLDPAEFKDKYVFFGFSATGLLDLRPTPLGGVTPGVVINATVLDNLLSSDFLQHTPTEATVLFTLLLSILAGTTMSMSRNAKGMLLVAAGCIAVPIVASLALYSAGWWSQLVVQAKGVTVALLGTGLYKYSTEGRQKRFIKSAFKQYLSPQVIDQLLADPDRLRLGGERREISIFFSDIQGFTTISEAMEPEELTSVLNDYLTAMTDIIQAEGGTVDKYEGDAIIAFWNAPIDLPDHACRAVRAALLCQDKLAEMRPELKQRTGSEVHMRIGLNTGAAVVGNLGSHSRFDYTMLGDAVNLAARLEGANKQFGTYTMCSQTTLDSLGDCLGQEFAARHLARLQVVGKNQAVLVHELFFPETAATRAKLHSAFAAGLDSYFQGRFTEAAAQFDAIATQDPAAAKYAAKCRTLETDPPEVWDGVWALTSK